MSVCSLSLSFSLSVGLMSCPLVWLMSIIQVMSMKGREQSRARKTANAAAVTTAAAAATATAAEAKLSVVELG